MTPPDDVSLPLEQLRPYLRMLARMQVDTRLQAKIDASDIVQQTMIEAHQAQGQYRGQSDEELRGWLRRIMARNLADEVRKVRRGKRDAGLERSMNVALGENSNCLDQYLAASDSLPDKRALRDEQMERLANALESLPDGQRQAVVMHHLQGQKAAEIAVAMGKTEIAVAGLLRRGLKQLREMLQTASE